MPESVPQWWQRRQWSKGVDVPYAPGEFDEPWSRYRLVAKHYRADRNHGVLLSQVPLAADVWLVFRCTLGHEWTATPTEQRERSGRGRGGRERSCPVCSAPPPTMLRDEQWVHAAGALPAEIAKPQHRGTTGRAPRASRARADHTSRPDLEPGAAFVDPSLRLHTSATEGMLKRALRDRLDLDFSNTSIRVAQPFHHRLEVWPDVILPELRVAIEYDTTGRIGDEHVGRHEASDRRKDTLLRRVGWEVIRLRGPGLAPIGPHDLACPARLDDATVDALVDRIAEVRGELLVAAYRR